MFSDFLNSLSILKKDKVILLLSIVPPVIGLIIYGTLGAYLTPIITDWGNQMVTQYIPDYPVVATLFNWLFGLFFLFVAGLTFFLLVSLIASPFNDVISSRVERNISGQTPQEVDFNFKEVVKVIKNELKKILFIAIFSIIGILLSFILPPASLIVSAVLMSVTFLDYSWSRHNFTTTQCMREFKSSFVRYLLSGFAFMFVISIPVVNVFFLPLGVIYFTTSFTKKRV